MGRQPGEKLQCLYRNLISNSFLKTVLYSSLLNGESKDL